MFVEVAGSAALAASTGLVALSLLFVEAAEIYHIRPTLNQSAVYALPAE